MLQELEESEEDAVYRFFHQSFKVFHVQKTLKAAHQLITEIGGNVDRPFAYFQDTIKAGTEGKFDGERTNAHWKAATERILKALWLTKYFLTQMVRHARTLESAVQFMPPGWAAVLYLYNLR